MKFDDAGATLLTRSTVESVDGNKLKFDLVVNTKMYR